MESIAISYTFYESVGVIPGIPIASFLFSGGRAYDAQASQAAH